MSSPVETPFGFTEICRCIPHRPPFLFVDKVLEIKFDESVHAIKCISALDPYFEGHFPGNPIFPGVYIIEGLAQATGILLAKTLESQGPDKITQCLLTGVQDARFRRQVVPGDVLHYHATVQKARGPFYWFSGTAKVDGQVVAEVKLSAMLGTTKTQKGK